MASHVALVAGLRRVALSLQVQRLLRARALCTGRRGHCGVCPPPEGCADRQGRKWDVCHFGRPFRCRAGVVPRRAISGGSKRGDGEPSLPSAIQQGFADVRPCAIGSIGTGHGNWLAMRRLQFASARQGVVARDDSHEALATLLCVDEKSAANPFSACFTSGSGACAAGPRRADRSRAAAGRDGSHGASAPQMTGLRSVRCFRALLAVRRKRGHGRPFSAHFPARERRRRDAARDGYAELRFRPRRASPIPAFV